MQDNRNTRRAASRWIAGGMVILAIVAITACGKMNTTGRSASYLLIDLLQGATGAKPDAFATVLQADVQTKGTIYEDTGKVTLRIALKDVGDVSAPSAPTTANWVTVTRYHVSFRRSDGRNTARPPAPLTPPAVRWCSSWSGRRLSSSRRSRSCAAAVEPSSSPRSPT